MSEIYFGLADDTVSAAERYSEQIATRIRWIEITSAVDMVLLAAMVIEVMLSAIRIARKNKVLEQKAYIDLHTGLPNKSRCEELLNEVKFITEPTACLMFDLNNLKHVNDTMGHSVGDQLIANFARLLRNAVLPRISWAGTAATSSSRCSTTPTAGASKMCCWHCRRTWMSSTPTTEASPSALHGAGPSLPITATAPCRRCSMR